MIAPPSADAAVIAEHLELDPDRDRAVIVVDLSWAGHDAVKAVDGLQAVLDGRDTSFPTPWPPAWTGDRSVLPVSVIALGDGLRAAQGLAAADSRITQVHAIPYDGPTQASCMSPRDLDPDQLRRARGSNSLRPQARCRWGGTTSIGPDDGALVWSICGPDDDRAPRGLILLLHDRGDNATMFEAVIPRLLDAGYRVAIPDLSYGASVRGWLNHTRGDALVRGLGERPVLDEAIAAFDATSRKSHGATCRDIVTTRCPERYIVWGRGEAATAARALRNPRIVGVIADAGEYPLGPTAATDPRLAVIDSPTNADGQLEPSDAQWGEVLELLRRAEQR